MQAGDDAHIFLSKVGEAAFPDVIKLNGSIQHQKVEDLLGGKFSLCFDPANPNRLHVVGW